MNEQNKKVEEMLAPKSRILRDEQRTGPDSDEAKLPIKVDRNGGCGYFCKHVHALLSYAFRLLQWVLTRVRLPNPEQKI